VFVVVAVLLLVAICAAASGRRRRADDDCDKTAPGPSRKQQSYNCPGRVARSLATVGRRSYNCPAESQTTVVQLSATVVRIQLSATVVQLSGPSRKQQSYNCRRRELAAEEEAATRTALMVADHNESVAVPVDDDVTDDDVTVAPAAGLPAGVDAACSGKTPAPDADCEVVDVTRATRYYRGCGPARVRL